MCIRDSLSLMFTILFIYLDLFYLPPIYVHEFCFVFVSKYFWSNIWNFLVDSRIIITNCPTISECWAWLGNCKMNTPDLPYSVCTELAGNNLRNYLRRIIEMIRHYWIFFKSIKWYANLRNIITVNCIPKKYFHEIL